MERSPKWVEIKIEVEDVDIKHEPLEPCMDHSVSSFACIFLCYS